MTLILMILFGLGTAFFATQNTGSVHLLIGNLVFRNIPLYVVVVGSILFGVFISWVISVIDGFSTFFTLHAKDVMVKQLQIKISELQNKNSQLEEELREINDLPNEEKIKTNPQEKVINPQLFGKLKKSVNISI